LMFLIAFRTSVCRPHRCPRTARLILRDSFAPNFEWINASPLAVFLRWARKWRQQSYAQWQEGSVLQFNREDEKTTTQ
jgi:hypothetical protein